MRDLAAAARTGRPLMAVQRADQGAGDRTDWSFATGRVRGRLIHDGDRDLYRALYTDAGVMARVGPALSGQQADALFDRVLRCNQATPVRARYWHLCERDGTRALGQFSLVRADGEPGTFDLGQMLVPGRQGQGLGLEIAIRMLDLLMGDHWPLGVRRVTAQHAPGNVRVAHFGQVLGFEHRGRDGDGLECWSLTRARWRATRAAGGPVIPAAASGAAA